MQCNVAQLLKEPTGSTRGLSVEEGFLRLGETRVDRLEGRLLLTRTDVGVWVHGVLRAAVPAQCGRCLEGFAQALRIDMDEQYYPSLDIARGTPLEADRREGDSFQIGPGHVLDVSEAVRQLVIARTPIMPLCSNRCAGLCPQCGANRNEAPCTCTESHRDPRWGRLRQTLFSQKPDL